MTHENFCRILGRNETLIWNIQMPLAQFNILISIVLRKPELLPMIRHRIISFIVNVCIVTTCLLRWVNNFMLYHNLTNVMNVWIFYLPLQLMQLHELMNPYLISFFFWISPFLFLIISETESWNQQIAWRKNIFWKSGIFDVAKLT